MSQEIYFGEVDVRRVDRFEQLLERIASKLEEAAPSASNNIVRNAIAQVREYARHTTDKPIGYGEFNLYLDWLEQQHP